MSYRLNSVTYDNIIMRRDSLSPFLNIGKPRVFELYKTRFMLDELGNLQSEGHGIQGLQTDLSIGLGQEQQFTLILQTLQQLRDVYGVMILSEKKIESLRTCNECVPLHQLNTGTDFKSLYATA